MPAPVNDGIIKHTLARLSGRSLMVEGGREAWTKLSDSQLLNQCKVDTYRASGPGGQKRNKTSSAVRLRHEPSGLIVIAEESRSQHENRLRALRRMRQALYLKIRNPLSQEKLAENRLFARAVDCGGKEKGRLALGRKDPRFWAMAGLTLDVLEATHARVAEAAAALGITTGNLIAFLSTDPKVWEQANQIRTRFGQKPLRG